MLLTRREPITSRGRISSDRTPTRRATHSYFCRVCIGQRFVLAIDQVMQAARCQGRHKAISSAGRLAPPVGTTINCLPFSM
jgi:hypothetical protein